MDPRRVALLLAVVAGVLVALLGVVLLFLAAVTDLYDRRTDSAGE